MKTTLTANELIMALASNIALAWKGCAASTIESNLGEQGVARRLLNSTFSIQEFGRKATADEIRRLVDQIKLAAAT